MLKAHSFEVHMLLRRDVGDSNTENSGGMPRSATCYNRVCTFKGLQGRI